MKRLSFKWLAAGLVLSAISVGAIGLSPHTSHAANTIDWQTTPVSHTNIAADTTASQNYAKSLSGAFRQASEAVMPSVVTIQSTATAPQTVVNGNGVPDELRNNPMFKRFFEGLPEGRLEQPEGRQRSGMGSGVIVDSTGIILTNNHVVEGAGRVVVKLHDGREFEAKEWKTDPKTDIAVVRIESATSLPAATIGDSDQLDIGDWVIAVGAPFGLDETVTAGIISAKSRGIGITDREEFLQTDAAINPGNSGGPLVNLNGEVVGINTAISSTSGGYQGIGFTIPINLARWVGDELITNGTVRRAFLGVGIQAVNDTLSKQFGLNTVRGAVVTDVRDGSPASKAGLMSGDVIVEFDGYSIGSPRELQGRVERASLEDSHKIVVIRNGKTVTMDVSVQAMPTEALTGGSSGNSPASPSDFGKLGLQLSDLTSDVAGQLGLNNVQGVVITGVKSGSIADKAGLEDGMVITKVGQTAVNSLDDFRAALNKASVADGILLLVRSGDASRFVVLKG